MSTALKQIEKYALPDGGTAGEWFIAKELGTFVVKRMLTLGDGRRTAQRAKRSDYAGCIDAYTPREREDQADQPGEDPKPPRALEDFVIRLNGKDPKAERLRLQVRFNHAWINDEFLPKSAESPQQPSAAIDQKICFTSCRSRERGRAHICAQNRSLPRLISGVSRVS